MVTGPAGGYPGLVKLLDFGLARSIRLYSEHETNLTVEGAILGTPAYMSPEQAEGKPLDARSDVFSFGAVLYHMLTGRQAFLGGSPASVLLAVLQADPLPLGTKIPDKLKKVVLRCLQKDPERRFQRMQDVQAALRGLTPAAPAPFPWRSAKPARLGVGLLVLLLALTFLLSIGDWRKLVLGRAEAPRIGSLAVLPVRNFSGDPRQESFADGMTDALIGSLAKIGAVRVISLTSAMHYKGTKETLPQIARELGVAGIVEASVVCSDGRVRITASLVDAPRDRDLWTNSYERAATDVLALQADVVRAIAEEIRAQITPQESERLKTVRRVDPEAYEDTFKGKAILEYATREGQLRHAAELFQKAIDRDPTYALAWAGLSEAWWDLAATGLELVAPEEVRGRAIAAAERALALDANLAEAHKARATIAIDAEWDLDKAQQHFEKALELRPGYVAAHNLYAAILAVPLNHFAEARWHLDQARTLDPLSPWNDVGLVAWWLYQRRPEKALKEAETSRRRSPKLWILPWLMGYSKTLNGQPGQAPPQFEEALELLSPERPAAVLAPLGLACGLAGRRDEALRILDELEQASRKRYISPYDLAEVHSGLGRMDDAFRFLERALEQRTPYLVFCTSNESTTVAFRRDPRWKPYMDRLRHLIRLPTGTRNPYL